MSEPKTLDEALLLTPEEAAKLTPEQALKTIKLFQLGVGVLAETLPMPDLEAFEAFKDRTAHGYIPPKSDGFNNPCRCVDRKTKKKDFTKKEKNHRRAIAKASRKRNRKK